MADNLKELIIEDAADGCVFFPKDSDGNPTEFNEQWTFYPEYSEAAKHTVNVVPDKTALEGSREVQGDGRVFNLPQGRAVRKSIRLSIPTSEITDLREEQPENRPDVFKDEDGKFWAVKRILQRGLGLTTVLCVRTNRVLTRMRKRDG